MNPITVTLCDDGSIRVAGYTDAVREWCRLHRVALVVGLGPAELSLAADESDDVAPIIREGQR